MDEGVANANLIVEAATERTDLKLSIFKAMDAAAPADCILATNTSSISITQIAAATNRPEQVIGMHFMNPVPVMKLVEVIRGYATSDATCAARHGTLQSPRKSAGGSQRLPRLRGQPHFDAHDQRGHHHAARRRRGCGGHRYGYETWNGAPHGPPAIGRLHRIGRLPEHLRVLHEGLGNPKYAPCPLLVNMVTAGHLGVKSGQGFYVHTPGSKDLVVAPNFPFSDIRDMKGSRERLHEIIFEADTPAGKRFDVLLLWLIVASVVTVMAETVPDWHDRYRGTFVALEWVFTGLFTIEYITRLLVVKRPLRYATSFFGLVDLLAILPLVGLLIPGSGSLRVIRIRGC